VTPSEQTQQETPDILDAVPSTDGADRPDVSAEHDEQVSRPAKLIRIASMVRTMLEEVRRAPLDEEGRVALRRIHERSLRELEGILSPALREELDEVALDFDADVPTESELRIAQAQLVGWLEGLFHGIQATLFTQQVAAQAQLDQMHRQRALEAAPTTPGQYL
jgi:hypothetical protein